MRKQEFLAQLREGLTGLPQKEIEERLTFYSEMIDDRMEEGLPEEEAVEAVGAIEEIVADIAQTKHKTTPKKQWKVWEIVLLVLGSPIWLSLLISALVVIFSLYIVLWSVIVSLWAVFGALFACALSGLAAGVGFAFGGHFLSGIAVFGAGMVCAGLSVVLLWGAKAAAKGTVRLTGRFLKKCFAGRRTGNA